MPTEISGYGEVHANGASLYIPNVLHVPPQSVSGGHTTLEAGEATRGTGDLGDIVLRYMKSMRDPDPQKRRDPSWLRFWFHSHCDFQAYFSTTDERTIAALAKETEPMLLVAGVMNQRGQSQWRVVVHGIHIQRRYDLEGVTPTEDEVAAARSRWLGDHIKEEFRYGQGSYSDWL